MIKKNILTVILAAIAMASSCNSGGKAVSYNISFNPFYSTPEEIISKCDKQSENFYTNYILARAYSQKKEYKTALLYYTNSCFKSRYNFSLRLFPQPIYAFIDSYSQKSPYYSDSLYEIASIFYQYNEHEYVIKFTSLISDDGSALYRDSVILKARSLQKLNRNSDAEKELTALAAKYSDSVSASQIYMKLGSVYESMEKFQQAASAYLSIIKAEKEAWHTDIAVKRILYLISSKGVKITENESRIAIAESLFSAKEYGGAEEFLSDLVKKGGNGDAELLYLKIITHKNYSESVRFLKSYEKKPEYDRFALAHANELWDIGNKNSAVQTYSKMAETADRDIAERILTRLSFYYEERNNPELIRYMEMYRKLFPEDSQSGRFTWLMGRYYLRSGNNIKASEYFAQGIKKYPDSVYTANSRYWLFKMNHIKVPADEAQKLKLLQDLAVHNPDSTHTLTLLHDYSAGKDAATLTEQFNEARKNKNSSGMVLFHTLLFMKQGYDRSFKSRIEDMDSSITDKYSEFNKRISGASYKSRWRSNLSNLEKYFAAGDIESVNRELNILPENDASLKTDVAIAMSDFSRRYGHYNYATFYAFRLLDSEDIQENLSLLSEEFSRSLYPDAFMNCVKTESASSKVSPSLVLGMIKSESNFNVTAVSPVGAAGLMQLMPATARGIANELKITGYDLKDPCTSVKFGAHYIAWLDRYYKGRVELMVAGYNAGAGNVDIWLKRFKDKDLDYISEFTPFPETRDYIFRTKKYMIQYQSVYGTE